MVSGGVGLTLAFVLPGITVPLLSFAVGDASAAEAAPVAWLPWMRAREVITEEILDELYPGGSLVAEVGSRQVVLPGWEAVG